MLHMQLLCTAWDVHESKMWCRAEALGHACSLVHGEVEKRRRRKLRAHLVQQGVPQGWLSHALWEGRLRCASHSLLWQMGSKQEKAAVLAGRIIYGVLGFVWDKSCLGQEAKFKCFKGWTQPLGYSAHTALKLLSVSVFHGRTYAAQPLSTPFLPTCPALKPG